MKPILSIIALALTGLITSPADQITAAEAKNYIGQTKTVCGVVASARYAERTKGQPTFLNLDKPYPGAIFTAVIWGEDKHHFGDVERGYLNKKICVTGKITEYRGVPEMVLKTPDQVTMDN